MKTYKSFLVLMLGSLILAGVSSCKKQLEAVVPQDRLSLSKTLTDPGAAQTLYNGVYSDFRSYNGTFFLLGEMRSDIWTDGLYTESGDGTLIQLYDQNISALSVPAGNWAGFYNLLYQVNNVINLFPKSPIPAAQRDQELAEMYGIRAFIYYTMLKTWGGVPLDTIPITTISSPAATYKPRSSADSIMIQIKSDIERSLTLFNGNNAFPAGKRVYWNRVATLTLKGDVYIWSGTLMGGGTADLTTAQSALQEVENLQGPALNLDANYADIFDPNKKLNNPEIIFALNYELNQAQQFTFSEFTVNNIQAKTLSFAQSNDPTQNVSYVYPYVGGANRVGMNAAMIAKLTSDSIPDKRIAGTFKIMYGNSAPFSIRGIMLTKWIGQASGTSQAYTNDYPIYRYADVLLLMAEAKAKLGQDPSPEIDSIRRRAYGPSYIPYVNGSVTDNMNAILNEGLHEFIGEGKRWWALRRAGDQYVYNAINPAYLSPGSTAKLLLPISVSMLNNDPLLTQTPGY
ncbi:MAG TPA: RagB/SusD family nutrient uptake outer membrane protein [Hanamia sp.]|jgi:hypothetical protein|nr:RagB/SusD family nutrient uptake outer membrane protein [Hanamia sp.]